uniref:EF-hand domain-containing protein n=1 Tax=viral metagenome TaxID=1070528 RepID=A0A6C0KTN1_9ZZZZ
MAKKSKTIQPPSSSPNPMFPQASPHTPSGASFFSNPLGFIHDHVQYLNSSKYFAGIVMILLNVGSKFISIQFSKSTEEYLKFSLSKQLLVFSMAWMGTRDIYVALGLTAIFVILSEHLFNEESSFCVVPHKYRVLHKLVDENNDGVISESEVNSAIAILEKAKKDKEKKHQKDTYAKYFNYDVVNNNP